MFLAGLLLGVGAVIFSLWAFGSDSDPGESQTLDAASTSATSPTPANAEPPTGSSTSGASTGSSTGEPSSAVSDPATSSSTGGSSGTSNSTTAATSPTVDGLNSNDQSIDYSNNKSTNKSTDYPTDQGEVQANDTTDDQIQPRDFVTQDGMYLVGSDIAPGRYVASGTGSLCYLAVTSDATGNLESVVRTHFGDAYGRRVELEDGQFFETDACGNWQLELAVRR